MYLFKKVTEEDSPVGYMTSLVVAWICSIRNKFPSV